MLRCGWLARFGMFGYHERIMPITSSSNAYMKQIRNLRHRKERERSGLFFVEGIRLVAEALQTGMYIEALVVAPELLTSSFAQELAQTQQERGLTSYEVTAEVFRSISLKDGPQGIGAVVQQRWESLDTVSQLVSSGAERLWVALDAIQDPGNLGTILRTCDAVGGAGVILLGPTTDPYDPVAVRASMGALFSQQVVRTGFARFSTWKQHNPVTIVGTSGAATSDYQQVAYQPPLILLMGSERMGLSADQQVLCDTVVRIPMVGRSDSLNVAVATAVMLYELFNQWRS